jgi:hypothetical protein
MIQEKMIAALETLRRRLDSTPLPIHENGKDKQRDCRVRFDRLGIASAGFAYEQFVRLPGFRRDRNHWVRRSKPEDFVAYGQLTRFSSTTSIREMCVLSEGQSQRLAPCKVTLTGWAASVPWQLGG